MSALHQGQPVARAGAPVDQAKAALVLVHGRGASADSILTLANELDVRGVACLAPQAAGGTWYPHSFMQPVAMNEPHLTSALAALGDVLASLAGVGLASERVVLVGFSQGACLASEFVARSPRRYGGLAVLSGGLIGEGDHLDAYEGSLARTPVFIGCSDVDPHIPLARVTETAAVLEGLDAIVDTRIYPNMAHTVNADEIRALQALINRVRNGDDS